MQTFFITANDTDVGKTYIMGLLARHFAAQGKTVQLVKALECGHSNDAACAQAAAAAAAVSCHTLLSYPEALAPLARGNTSQGAPSMPALLNHLHALPQVDVRLVEGAGGVAVPIDPDGLDWRDFAQALMPDCTLVVVDDRLGSINQSRLLHDYLGALPHAFILNQRQAIDAAVHESNLDAYHSHRLPLLACVGVAADSIELRTPDLLDRTVQPAPPVSRCNPRLHKLEVRKAAQTLRDLTVRAVDETILNLADNDTLNLRQHPLITAAARQAISHWGTSSSASPLITGYTAAHAKLEQALSAWYANRPALIWNSGYAANQALLKLFIDREDLILADRLIHHSLISGALSSGARLIRFRHNDLKHLEALLATHGGTRKIHLVTESVYSMDGDYPDLRQIAQLKSKYPFNWLLDEAHALGWYGASGSGLAEAMGVLEQVDLLIGTLGKALASSGAYTIFKHTWMRDYCINEAGEFIYSTYLPPAAAVAADTALELIRQHSQWRTAAQASASAFRETLREQGWDVLGTDSAVVPVLCGDSDKALTLAAHLLQAGIRVGAIRPPTVAQGQARLRISLKATLTSHDYTRLADCFQRSHMCDA